MLGFESPGQMRAELASTLGFKKRPVVVIGGNDARAGRLLDRHQGARRLCGRHRHLRDQHGVSGEVLSLAQVQHPRARNRQSLGPPSM